MKSYKRYWDVDGKRPPTHRKIWEKYHQQKLPKNWVVHHKDANKRNNEITNLIAMTRSDHSRLHAGQVKENGRWKAKCKVCCLWKDVHEDFYKRYKGKCSECIRKSKGVKGGRYRSKYNSEICPCCKSKVVLGKINTTVLK